VVFLRPKILRDADAYGAMTSERYQQIIGEQKRPEGSRNNLMPDIGPTPVLPPWAPEPKSPATPETKPADPKQ